MTIRHEYIQWPSSVSIDRDYGTNEVTFIIEQDTETTLEVTMSLEEARDLTRGLH